MAVKFYVLPVSWCILIALLLLTPGDKLPHAENLWEFDKLAHVGVFAVMAVLVLRGVSKQKNNSSLRYKTIFFVLLGCISYGFILELLQILVPNRDFDVNDIVANSTGVVVGIGAYRIISKTKFTLDK